MKIKKIKFKIAKMLNKIRNKLKKIMMTNTMIKVMMMKKMRMIYNKISQKKMVKMNKKNQKSDLIKFKKHNINMYIFYSVFIHINVYLNIRKIIYYYFF